MFQVCLVNDTGFVAASLVIICEILRARNDIRIALFGQFQSASTHAVENKKEIKLDQADSGDSEEEKFIDVDRAKEKKV